MYLALWTILNLHLKIIFKLIRLLYKSLYDLVPAYLPKLNFSLPPEVHNPAKLNLLLFLKHTMLLWICVFTHATRFAWNIHQANPYSPLKGDSRLPRTPSVKLPPPVGNSTWTCAPWGCFVYVPVFLTTGEPPDQTRFISVPLGYLLCLHIAGTWETLMK